jgi:hypothetical protein
MGSRTLKAEAMSWTAGVVMHEGFSTREIWHFECLHCHHVWEVEYSVRHLTDGHGNEVDVWLLGDLPAMPPPSGARCPSCAGSGVTVFPRGYLSHHPELLTTAPAEGGLVGLEPAGDYDGPQRYWPMGAAGHWSRDVTLRLLCLAVVVATLVVAAGYEIFERLLPATRLH